MKTTLTVLILLISLSAYSQDTPKYVYCELVGMAKLFSTKVTVAVDYGEDKSFQDTRIKDETGKVATFNSMVDALNYMGTKDWQFVQAYVVAYGSQNVYRWLLKKKSDKRLIK